MAALDIDMKVEPADSADARWCLEQYYSELAARFDAGFDPAAVNNFAPAEMMPPKGWFLIARRGGEAVGCGALKRLKPSVAEVKRVWVSPTARGLGLAGRLMDQLEGLAAENGFSSVVLDTNKTLLEARAMYAKRGYREIGRYNDNPYADHWFEKKLR
jgi:ribosomal protein S18 acetylase RimI-like enzyme